MRTEIYMLILTLWLEVPGGAPADLRLSTQVFEGQRVCLQALRAVADALAGRARSVADAPGPNAPAHLYEARCTRIDPPSRP